MLTIIYIMLGVIVIELWWVILFLYPGKSQSFFQKRKNSSKEEKRVRPSAVDVESKPQIYVDTPTESNVGSEEEKDIKTNKSNLEKLRNLKKNQRN